MRQNQMWGNPEQRDPWQPLTSMSNFGFQPQSFLANESSMLRGQVVAMACRRGNSCP